MIQKNTYDDSFTLHHFMQIDKKQTLNTKKKRKESQSIKRQRKESTQLSIVGWLNQVHPNKKILLHSLDKYLILKIFSYLRLTDLVIISQVSSYFFSCYKSLWNDKDYFCQLETDKFTQKQLQKLMEKSSRLDHIKYLKHIYSGKNMKYRRQKIKIKVGQWAPNTGGMLQVFSVSPKNVRSGSTFIMDCHIKQIVNSSFKSLLIIQLIRCSFLKQFSSLSRCLQLKKLTITCNDNFSTQNLGLICKLCKQLNSIHIDECKRLDQNIFGHLRYVQSLQQLYLRNFKHSFLKIQLLEILTQFTYLDIKGSLITDIEATTMMRKLQKLNYLSLKSCHLLTDTFIDNLIVNWRQNDHFYVEIDKNNFSQNKIHLLQAIINKKS